MSVALDPVLADSADNEALNLLSLLTNLGNTSVIEMKPDEFGMLSASSNLSKWVMLCLVAPLVVRLLGATRAPVVSIRVGAALGAVLLAPWGIAQSKVQLYVLVCAQSVAVISVPAIRSMLSAAHPPAAQGGVLGAISVMETLAMFITPLVGGYLWAATVSVGKSALSFAALASILAAASIASFFLTPITPLAERGVGTSAEGREEVGVRE